MFFCFTTVPFGCPPTPRSFKGNSTKEVIAACGYDSISLEIGSHFFTDALIHTLVIGSKEPPFSVGEPHSRVLSRPKCWLPDLLTDGDGNFLMPDGELQYERQLRLTPIYSILRENEPRRRIILQTMKSNSFVSEDQL